MHPLHEQDSNTVIHCINKHSVIQIHTHTVAKSFYLPKLKRNENEAREQHKQNIPKLKILLF